MGVRAEATATTAEAFSGLSIAIGSRWGFTHPIIPNRGLVEGSVSGSEQAKPSQSRILSIRAVSNAFHTTFRLRKVHAAGFVDDTERYESGAHDLAIIMRSGLATPGLSSQFFCHQLGPSRQRHWRFNFPGGHPRYRMGYMETRNHKRDNPQSVNRHRRKACGQKMKHH